MNNNTKANIVINGLFCLYCGLIGLAIGNNIGFGKGYIKGSSEVAKQANIAMDMYVTGVQQGQSMKNGSPLQAPRMEWEINKDGKTVKTVGTNNKVEGK